MGDASRSGCTKQLALAAHKAVGHRRWIHFTEMSHDDRHGCIGMFNCAPWHGVVVASDTTSVREASILAKPRFQYNYAARYVIERISARAAELGETATIYFEDRRNFDLAEFRRYMERVLASDTPRLDASVIDPGRIYQMPKGRDHILCIADALAYSAYRALEPHRLWKRCERSYLEALARKLWRGPGGRGDLRKWGLILRPTDLWGPFATEYPWLTTLHGA